MRGGRFIKKKEKLSSSSQKTELLCPSPRWPASPSPLPPQHISLSTSGLLSDGLPSSFSHPSSTPLKPPERFLMEKSERFVVNNLCDGSRNSSLMMTEAEIGLEENVSFKSNIEDGYAEAKRSKAASALAGRCVVRGQWTAEEDSLLMKLVKENGVRKWSHIAKKLVGRIGKQCRK